MNSPHVILVEDDAGLREGLKEFLQLSGCSVIAVGTGLEFFATLIQPQGINVAVIDLGLPDIAGQRLVEHLRLNTQIKIIVLTANNALDTRIESYNLGADLYMTKPVDSRELAAAVHSLAERQIAVHVDAKPVNENEWILNQQTWELYAPEGVAIHLKSKEFLLIQSLASSQGELLSREALCRVIYRRHDASAEAALSTLVKRTRQHIAGVCQCEVPIQTSHGAGYRFASHIKLR